LTITSPFGSKTRSIIETNFYMNDSNQPQNFLVSITDQNLIGISVQQSPIAKDKAAALKFQIHSDLRSHKTILDTS